MQLVLSALSASSCSPGTYFIRQSGSKGTCEVLKEGNCYDETAKAFKELSHTPLKFKSETICGSCTYVTNNSNVLTCTENC